MEKHNDVNSKEPKKQKNQKKQQVDKKVEVSLSTPLISPEMALLLQQKMSNLPLKIIKKKKKD